jgi:uncharacterized damage-inducible protein DinB
MAFADTFLPEFDAEMKTTRSLLERVPFENGAWKPHTKSMSLVGLATHITQLAGYGAMVATTDEFNTANRGPSPSFANRDHLLSAFDENVAKSRAALSGLQDAQLGAKWTLRMGDQVFLALPRAAAIRTLLMSHMIHHRGQLSVYLRQNEVLLPSIYGPTADT